MDVDSLTPLQQAIRNAGGIRALGRALGISAQAVDQWERCPAERVLRVESVTGVSRHDLRPDIYPREKKRR